MVTISLLDASKCGMLQNGPGRCYHKPVMANFIQVKGIHYMQALFPLICYELVGGGGGGTSYSKIIYPENRI